MNRLDKLKQLVESLYSSKNPERDEWSDWIYPNHVLTVASYAESLAPRFSGSTELAVAAALLHDIADSVMSRFNSVHSEKSKEIANNLLLECGYGHNEIDIIINDAIANHSCRNGQTPSTIDGKIMATADALAHLKTDFYIRALKRGKSKDWVNEKIERDFNVKIQFDDVRNETRHDYESLKNLVNES